MPDPFFNQIKNAPLPIATDYLLAGLGLAALLLKFILLPDARPATFIHIFMVSMLAGVAVIGLIRLLSAQSQRQVEALPDKPATVSQHNTLGDFLQALFVPIISGLVFSAMEARSLGGAASSAHTTANTLVLLAYWSALLLIFRRLQALIQRAMRRRTITK